MCGQLLTHVTMCRVQESEYRDLLDLILHGKMRAGEAWSATLQTQLCYELKTFLLAGHETSAAMLTLTLLELISNGELRRRVVEEADAVLGKSGTGVRVTVSDCSCICFLMIWVQKSG
jgi:cytochrome P450